MCKWLSCIHPRRIHAETTFFPHNAYAFIQLMRSFIFRPPSPVIGHPVVILTFLFTCQDAEDS